MALVLLTGYYSVVAFIHQRRSMRATHALAGAGILAALTTVATVWSVNGSA